MADVKEQIAKIEELAKTDEQFRNDFVAATASKDIDAVIKLIHSKGFDLTAEDLGYSSDESLELDDAELAAVAGGEGRISKLGEYWDYAGALLCGFGLGVAMWSPDYESDEGDAWYD